MIPIRIGILKQGDIWWIKEIVLCDLKSTYMSAHIIQFINGQWVSSSVPGISIGDPFLLKIAEYLNYNKIFPPKELLNLSAEYNLGTHKVLCFVKLNIEEKLIIDYDVSLVPKHLVLPFLQPREIS